MISSLPVIPAKAGTQVHNGYRSWSLGRSWVPAFAGMTMVGLALTGCGFQSADRAVAVPDPVQAAADAASTAYATCIQKAAATIELGADQPPVLASKAWKSCNTLRAEVVAKVAAAQAARGTDAALASTIAERSVRVADSELRERANAAIVTRKLKTGG